MILALVLAAHASSQISVDTLSVDGVEVRELSCALDSGGLLGPIAVVAAVATAKDALDACAPRGAAFRAEWTWAGGDTQAIGVKQASLHSAAACVEQALGGVTSNLAGRCSAVLLVGDTAAAEAARDAVKDVK